MSNETKKTALPKLRFPEFRGAGEWEEKPLGTIASFYKGKGLPKSEIIPGGLNPCIHYGELFTEYTEVIEKIKSRTNTTSGVTSLANDVLMPTSDVTPSGLAKASCVKSDGVILGGDILIIRTKSSIINGEFLSRYIRKQEQSVLRLVTGSTVYHLYASAMEKFTIEIPPTYSEQQKIAATLSSLDDLITAQNTKLAALQAHKRGLMQGLFPAEGETVPKLRFPEFQEAGEWEEKQLKDICKMQAGKFVTASSIHANNQGDFFPCYGGNGLRGYTKTFTHEGKYSLVGRQGALCGNVMLATGKFHATEHAVVTKPKAAVNTDWLYYLLVILDLNQYATGAAQPGLSVQNLEKLEIRIPNAEAEQQKIAITLSSLDNRITAQSQKIEALKLHKKGLMQNLFPAAAEPTA